MRIYMDDNSVESKLKVFGHTIMACVCVMLALFTAIAITGEQDGYGTLGLTFLFSFIYVVAYRKIVDLCNKSSSNSGENSSLLDDDDD